MRSTLIDAVGSRQAAADAIVQVRRDALEVGARRLRLAAEWADLHGVAVTTVVMPGMPNARQTGADGTPEVEEFAAEGLGCLLGVHPHAAHVLIADATNLLHRHPLLWTRVQDAEVVEWIATKTARKVAAAGLGLDKARWVDAQTAPFASSLPPGRYFALVEAKIIEADAAAAERRRTEAELERFVRTGQSDEHGLKTLVARAEAGDVTFFMAMVHRIAEILDERGDTDLADVRRSKAIGVLANPQRALDLLRGDDGEGSPLPPVTLFVHVSQETLETGTGVGRIEGLGPVTAGQVQSFLRHCNVTVRPVIDLDGGMPVDSWEVPARMRAVSELRRPHDVFPWSTSPSRGADLDHSKRYVPPNRGGPPGQTHPDKLGPLVRRHHRLKTHAHGWRHQQLLPGVYLWRTPTGHWLRVDRHGTHHLGREVSVLEQRLGALVAGA